MGVSTGRKFEERSLEVRNMCEQCRSVEVSALDVEATKRGREDISIMRARNQRGIRATVMDASGRGLHGRKVGITTRHPYFTSY